jgi:hypothetical protein
MPGVGGMAQPGMNRGAGLSGYRQRKGGKSVPVPSKKAPAKRGPKAGPMMYEERKASMQPPKSRKQAPQKRTSVRMQQPKFK